VFGKCFSEFRGLPWVLQWFKGTFGYGLSKIDRMSLVGFLGRFPLFVTSGTDVLGLTPQYMHLMTKLLPCGSLSSSSFNHALFISPWGWARLFTWLAILPILFHTRYLFWYCCRLHSYYYSDFKLLSSLMITDNIVDCNVNILSISLYAFCWNSIELSRMFSGLVTNIALLLLSDFPAYLHGSVKLNVKCCHFYYCWPFITWSQFTVFAF
jgi:hypothetical protein